MEWKAVRREDNGTCSYRKMHDIQQQVGKSADKAA